MQKRVLSVILIILLAIVCLGLVGCLEGKFVQTIEFTPNQTVKICEDGFVFSKYTITVHYTDGTSREIPITDEMISPTEQVKLHKQGEWTVEVNYLGFTTTFDVTVTKSVIEDFFTLEDVVLDYDGLPHSFRVEDDVPAGLTVTYPNGYSFIDAGEYNFKVVVKGDGYDTVTKSCKITINKIDYDLDASGRVLQTGESFIYDGSVKTVGVENLPGDLTVAYSTYKINANGTEDQVREAIDAGEYAVYVQYTCSDRKNYNPIPNERITFTIEKAIYDLSAIHFVSQTITYDGNQHVLMLNDEKLLPEGVTVKYQPCRTDVEPVAYIDRIVDAGVYDIAAQFTVGNTNYRDIPDMHANLIVLKDTIDMSQVRFVDAKYSFDGEGHTITVDNLPNFVVVNYNEPEPKYAAGDYRIVAHFSLDTPEHDNNYNLSKTELSAWLIIDTITVEMEFDTAKNLSFRESDNWFDIVGTPAKVDVTVTVYSDSDHTNEVTKEIGLTKGKTYYCVVTFAYQEEPAKSSCEILQVNDIWQLQ